MRLHNVKSLPIARIGMAGFLVLLFMSMSCRDAPASGRQLVWHEREQFVALERQDPNPDGPAPPNDHPADLSLERLVAFLDSLDLRPEENERPGPLFTKASLEILVPQLQQALRRASPGEDVTFAVIGLHDTLLGFAKRPKVTTGRMFYRNGRINLIVGLAQKDVNDREDRRLSPFTPGSRRAAAAGDWALLPHAGHGGVILARRDWAVSTEDGGAPAIPPPPAAHPVAPAPSCPVAGDARPGNSRTPAERLATLNELKEKGLISEEEYQGKRREILNGL